MTLQPAKDSSTVYADGTRKSTLIDGVYVRPAVTQIDDRGSLTEIYDPRWGMDDFPLVYVYQTTVRPGKWKGWVVHYIQTDRLFVSSGHLKIVLWDSRPESPTYNCVNEHFLTEQNRGLLRIPPHVYHLVVNIGQTDAMFINMPSHPYNHENPDKYRLPINNDIIPYKLK
ncbi:MAG: dTDP-4-dehydrorhamnose 3,5-epimerase family protein [Anaerolinea sp.]|nr:dTDP-4-dehydrorhamnose 3,5-epimerase family protein [Anaerolinea sp.]